MNEALDISEFRNQIVKTGQSVDVSDYQNVQETIIASDDCFWQPTDFPNLSPDRVQKAMAKLVSEKELIRIIRGLYWRGPRDETNKIIQPSAFEITKKILGLDYGIGYTGISAFRKLGIPMSSAFLESIIADNPSAENQVFIAIPYRCPRNVPNTVLVNRLSAKGRIQAELNLLEVTFLEVLGDWPNMKKPQDTERIKELFYSFQSNPELSTNCLIRPANLVQASRTENVLVRDTLINLCNFFKEEQLANKIPPVRKRNYHPGLLIK